MYLVPFTTPHSLLHSLVFACLLEYTVSCSQGQVFSPVDNLTLKTKNGTI